ncbi:ligand-binding sensor domain-containing protein [Chryseobacterium populi]|uniref:Fused histidine kinase/two component regulator n=1 Tax=Chryseobacterium populi TaxID=1144316 RepID=J2K8S0_9FLAO|nr:HAMP domain-containing sensor histidine kinase [Chryseobacterium populi]EJL69613.1 fused histidine kinase/two component regulator [Chryseobacterium populi]
MYKNIFSVFLFIFFSTVHSQKYNTEFYNTDNGLPQNSVKDIVKDKYGFIWMTTENGLVRYDGINFLVYKNFPLNSQRFTYFYGNIEKDSIFTGIDYGNKVLLHGKYPKAIRNLKKIQNIITKGNTNYFLYCSNYNFDTTQGGSFYMNFKNGRYYIKENALIYASYDSGAEENLKIKLIHTNIPKIFVLDEQMFYIDSQAKKVRKIEANKITNSYTSPLLTDINSKIFWNRVNNQVFILNKNTFYTCLYEKGQLKVTRLVQIDLKGNNLRSVYYDQFYRKLYLGDGTKGLQIISLSDFVPSKRDSQTFPSVFYSTLPYSDSSVITPSGDIYHRNGFVGTKNFKNYTQYFTDYDDKGNIIIKNERELRVYQKKSSYRDFVLVSTEESQIKDFFYDENRYYMLTIKSKIHGNTEFNGMLTLYKDKSFGEIEKKFFFNIETTKFLKTDNDHILVGTINGLYKVSLKSNKISRLATSNNLSIRNIVRTRDGNFWVTTLGKGFYLLKNDILIKMPCDINQNLSSAHTILEDQKGFFWIPSNNGLYRVHKDQLLKYAENKNYTVHYYRFSKKAGFDTNEFNGGCNITGNQLKNGEFVLPSLDGLVFFDPMKVKAYYPQNIYLERAQIDDKEVYFQNRLYATQKSNRIDIFIDVPYYANTDNIMIYAKLSGVPNAKWELIGKNRKFSAFNLGYGNHLLTIKMLVSDSGKFAYKKVNIIIPPYFYQTFWFKTLVFLGLSFLVYLLVKWRIGFLTRKNYELEKIISLRTKNLSDTVENLEITKIKLRKEIELQKKLIGTITHDITTPVKFIAMITDEVMEKKEFDQLRTEKVFSSIHKSSHQLYNFTMTLKEYADIYYHHRSDESKLYSLYKLVEEKKILFNAIAENNNTIINNDVNKNIYTWISKNILAAIIHNLLDNSVKFTKNGAITISSDIYEENIILMLQDTGTGMDEQKIEYYTQLQDNIEHEKLLLQKYGMGLHLVLQLLQMIESKIIFKKNKLRGTSFTLILKNKKDD